MPGSVPEETAAWFAENWDPDLTVAEWWRRLADSGLGFPTWPREWYGRGWDSAAARVVADERRKAGALAPPSGIATMLAAPTILAWGTEEQKTRFLPAIVAGEVWCQLFSEPGSGSDLASVQTRAVRDGEEWVVNGQKVWTSGAHLAHYGILIARTNLDVDKHSGVTYFVIDMQQPGIEVRPIKEMTGEAIFNEVFFTDARVPHENVLGPVDGGWRVAVTTLAHERSSLGAGSMSGGGGMGGLTISRLDPATRAGDLVGPTRSEPRTSSFGGSSGDLLVGLARELGRTGDPLVRQDIARVYTLLEIARYTALRARAATERGGTPGPEVSIGKLAASVLVREVRDSMLRTIGPWGTLSGSDDLRGGRIARMVLSSPLWSIGGGTDEVQKTLVGERVLGLPAEPRVDKGLPFRELRVGTQTGDRR